MDSRQLLSIYLNDHLAGATVGAELVQRMAKAEQRSKYGPPLSEIAAETKEDREQLISIMAELGVSRRRYLVAFAWAGEKVGRLKLNGRLLARSPLSILVELEILRLGIEGKQAMWRSLRNVQGGGAPSSQRLTELIARARDQAERVEKLRILASAEIFGSPEATSTNGVG